jgi:hypothetical protein
MFLWAFVPALTDGAIPSPPLCGLPYEAAVWDINILIDGAVVTLSKKILMIALITCRSFGPRFFVAFNSLWESRNTVLRLRRLQMFFRTSILSAP